MNSNGSTPSFSRTLANGVGKLMAPAQFRGKVRLTNWAGGIAGRFTPEVDCQPVSGARITVSLNDRIGRMMWTGCYEAELVELLRLMLDPGMTFVDVGAQVGYFSTTAAALVGPAGAVHSFEPDPDCFSMLQRNARAYPWVRVYNSAVAISRVRHHFIEVQNVMNRVGGAMFDEGGGRKGQRSRAHVGRLGGGGRDRKDRFIKIDVEGAEYRVLEGARNVIAATRPLIWVEANEVCLSRDGKSVWSLLRLLEEWDYAAHGLYERRSQSLENIAAIPRERVDLLEKIGRVKIGLRAIASDAVDGNRAAV